MPYRNTAALQRTISSACRFALLEDARLLIDLPFPNLLSISKRTLVPKLAILVITLPRANLLARIKRACLQRLSIFTPPFPVAVQLTIKVFASRHHTAAFVVEGPLSMTLPILEMTFKDRRQKRAPYGVR
jgi:hypothetical protein